MAVMSDVKRRPVLQVVIAAALKKNYAYIGKAEYNLVTKNKTEVYS